MEHELNFQNDWIFWELHIDGASFSCRYTTVVLSIPYRCAVDTLPLWGWSSSPTWIGSFSTRSAGSSSWLIAPWRGGEFVPVRGEHFAYACGFLSKLTCRSKMLWDGIQIHSRETYRASLFQNVLGSKSTREKRIDVHYFKMRRISSFIDAISCICCVTALRGDGYPTMSHQEGYLRRADLRRFHLVDVRSPSQVCRCRRGRSWFASRWNRNYCRDKLHYQRVEYFWTFFNWVWDCWEYVFAETRALESFLGGRLARNLTIEAPQNKNNLHY